MKSDERRGEGERAGGGEEERGRAGKSDGEEGMDGREARWNGEERREKEVRRMRGATGNIGRMDESTDGWQNTHLLIQLHILHHFQRQRKIAEEDMDAQQAYNAEEAEHAIERADAEFAYDFAVIHKDRPATLVHDEAPCGVKTTRRGTHAISSSLFPSLPPP